MKTEIKINLELKKQHYKDNANGNKRKRKLHHSENADSIS